MRTSWLLALALTLGCSSSPDAPGNGPDGSPGGPPGGQGPNANGGNANAGQATAPGEGTGPGAREAGNAAGPQHAMGGPDGAVSTQPVPPGASLRIVSPADGSEVSSPFTVEFDVQNMVVQLATGEVMYGQGHHNLIINGEGVAERQPIPDESPGSVIQYDEGEVSDELELPAGDYALTAQFSDGRDRSYGQALSHTINITVVGGDDVETVDPPEPPNPEPPNDDASEGDGSD